MSESWETADVKTCPHGYVFTIMCPDCKGWLDVKKQLPTKDGRYLVVEDNHYRWVGVCAMRNGKFDIEITHWMPLPEPPK